MQLQNWARTSKIQKTRNRKRNRNRPEITEIKTKQTYFKKKINESKRWFFEQSNKIDRSLAKLNNRKKEMTQIIRIGSEQEINTTDTNEIQNSLRGYF